MTAASSPAPSSESATSAARVRRLVRWLPLVLATVFLAQRTIRDVLSKVGHPAAALDDAYIHFQYARAFAEGHPFRFQAGEPISTGATSFLWPTLLAPFYLLGFRGPAIVWPAWLLSFAALGALAYETYRLAGPLAGRAAALGAGAMALSFGGLVWGAGSGMEVVPFAWLIARATRQGAEWAEREEGRTQRGLRALVVLAVLCPLMRPEGALTSLALGAIVFAFPPPRAWTLGWRGARADVSRALGLVFLGAALAPNLLLLALTGSATGSTAQVKLLPGHPYYVLSEAVLANARVLVGTLLDGQVWSAEFLPRGGAAVACAGLAALAYRGQATRRGVRAGLVLLLALSMFIPCFYVTFLWNRLRYLWPFAPGWFVGLACLARSVGQLVTRIDARAGAPTAALVAGAFAGMLTVRLEWVIEDVAQSASGIDRQQAALGRWAKENLPPDARIGVNDTGAIAYFGDRKTFDVVGLTTPSEGRFWVAGAASRLEHYERLRATSPSALPTHFIVYPEWMACAPVLGRHLHDATVTDATILGGQTMRASEARWDHLGTGENPWTALPRISDTLDVADLESEAAHRYELLGARDGEQAVEEGNAPDGAVILDGGRTQRIRDRFVATLPAEGAALGVARLDATTTTPVRVRVGDRLVATLELEAGPWVELGFEIPPDLRGAQAVEVEADAPFTAYHYWFGTR